MGGLGVCVGWVCVWVNACSCVGARVCMYDCMWWVGGWVDGGTRGCVRAIVCIVVCV